MPRLIDANKLKKDVLDLPDCYNGFSDTYDKACIIGVIDEQPAIEPKKGKWSFIGDNMFECTCCGTPYTTQQLNGLRNYNTVPYAPKFCPNCGADMRGEQDE